MKQERIMKKRLLVTVSMAFLFCATIVAAEFKLYPGAKEDQKTTEQGAESIVYTTADSFAKVAAFYKGIGKEYSMPRASGTTGRPKKGPGYDLWEAYFVFEGANDLATSKLWAKVQRPYIGRAPGAGKIGMQSGRVQGPAQSVDVRDVTAIVLARRK